MIRRCFPALLPLVFVLLLQTTLLISPAVARDKAEDWLEVRTPHFVVVSNGNQKQTQVLIEQFERMRTLFQKAFPQSAAGGGPPITVIAVKSEKDFRALEPEAYLAKGQLKLGGYFLRAADNNFILVRLNAEGDHPYAIVYHEYTHFLLRKTDEWMPLWLNEGLAEFYENTEIRDKDPVMGQPSQENILWLRQNRLLPLATLFAVDRNSPYYHEENKGSIFYAESWAVTHYLMMRDFDEHTTKLREYMELVARNTDPVAAATRVFGDLGALQKGLDRYVAQTSFRDLILKGALAVGDVEYKTRPLTFAQAGALRAELLAYMNRAADAQTLAEAVLKEDPNSALAHEVMGYLKFRQGELTEAQQWYEKAVKLDSQSYMAHYYYAAITMSRGRQEKADDAQIESSLRTAIKLNPQFAPAYDQLAVYFGMRQKNLDEAHMLSVQAISLDPANLAYRMNSANLLMANHREEDAIRVLRNALKVAKSPAAVEQVENAVLMAEQYHQAQKDFQEHTVRETSEEDEAGAGSVQSAPSEDKAGESDGTPPALRRRTEAVREEPAHQVAKRETAVVLRGPRRTLVGKIKGVRCSSPAILEFNLEGKDGMTALRSENYYKIEFSATGFVPTGELHPCTEIEGMRAQVQFLEASSGKAGQITAVELRK
jgi:Tfp pilus assembly protein PilF